jgi:hypothetical protein
MPQSFLTQQQSHVIIRSNQCVPKPTRIRLTSSAILKCMLGPLNESNIFSSHILMRGKTAKCWLFVSSKDLQVCEQKHSEWCVNSNACCIASFMDTTLHPFWYLIEERQLAQTAPIYRFGPLILPVPASPSLHSPQQGIIPESWSLWFKQTPEHSPLASNSPTYAESSTD